MRVLLPIVCLTVLALAGCGDIAPPQRRGPMAPPGIDIPRSDTPATPTANRPPPPPPPPGATQPPVAAQPGQPAQPAPGMNRVEAGVGVGSKGHYGAGVITTPLDVYWRAQERITFNIQIAENMKLFKAMNDNKAPATHEEFMQKIIKEGLIKLPDLPQGHRYVYDPQKEQLMVERPAPANQ
jgi:hypothetical protein